MTMDVPSAERIGNCNEKILLLGPFTGVSWNLVSLGFGDKGMEQMVGHQIS